MTTGFIDVETLFKMYVQGYIDTATYFNLVANPKMSLTANTNPQALTVNTNAQSLTVQVK